MDNEGAGFTNFNNAELSHERLTRLVIRGGAVVMLIIFALLAWMVVQSFHFRVVSTSPRSNNTSNISPFITINFNRDLSNKSLSITSNPSIITTTKIEGKKLVLNLNAPSAPLDTNKTYTITIKNITSTKGESLTNKIISFKPKVLDQSKIPKDQAKALLNRQAQPQPNTKLTFTGEDELINQGFTFDQISALEQTFRTFAPKAKAVEINTDTVTAQPADPNSDSGQFIYTFTVKVDNTTYKAKVLLNDPIVHVYLYSITDANNPVFDSGDIDSSTESGD